MRPYHIALMVLSILFVVLFVVIGMQQGRANQDCRKAGGVPVEVAPSGYECIHTTTPNKD